MAVWSRFLKDERGATIIEYCVVAGLVSIGLITSFISIGTKVNNMLTPVSGGLN